MKWILALAALVSLPVQATLIEYTYGVQVHQIGSEAGSGDDRPGTARIVVDTDSKTLSEFFYQDDFSNTVSWSGSLSPTVAFVSTGSDQRLLMAAYATIGFPGTPYYGFYLEHNPRIYEGSGLNYLDTINMESYFEVNLADDGFEYWAFVRSASKRIVSVPEPATLSLLALGLAAIGIRRRRHS